MTSRIIPRLLAVDDDDDCAELIVRLAHRSGYSGSALRDSRALGLVLLNEHPNVITLDLSMPEIDGIEALEILRNSRFRGHLIVVSGHPTCMRQHACEPAKSYGLRVAGHFHKPIALKDGDLLRRLAEDLMDATAKAKPVWTRKSGRTQERDDSAARAL
jgi:CheY-like chemotaxis protein